MKLTLPQDNEIWYSSYYKKQRQIIKLDNILYYIQEENNINKFKYRFSRDFYNLITNYGWIKK